MRYAMQQKCRHKCVSLVCRYLLRLPCYAAALFYKVMVVQYEVTELIKEDQEAHNYKSNNDPLQNYILCQTEKFRHFISSQVSRWFPLWLGCWNSKFSQKQESPQMTANSKNEQNESKEKASTNFSFSVA